MDLVFEEMREKQLEYEKIQRRIDNIHLLIEIHRFKKSSLKPIHKSWIDEFEQVINQIPQFKKENLKQVKPNGFLNRLLGIKIWRDPHKNFKKK